MDLHQVTLRRGNPLHKPSKLMPKSTTYVVADSTAKESDMRAARPPTGLDSKVLGGLEAQRSCEATLHSGYENIAGNLTHVNNKNGYAPAKNGYSNGFHKGFNGEPGRVRSVPDSAILDISPKAMSISPQLAPRSYEALQMFDSAPRGYSLVQPS